MVTSAQAWAVVVAVLASGMSGAWAAAGALIAILFLIADDRERRRAALGGDRG